MRASSKNSDSIHQLWLTNFHLNGERVYHPAVLVECKLTFRSLRASYHHSEERIFTAWYPETDLPVDWDRSPITLSPGTKFSSAPQVELPLKPGNYYFTPERLAEMEEVLSSRLLRTEKLRLLYNPIFKIYSTPEETRDQFHQRVSEKALIDLEPELKELMRRFELKLEQVREAEERKGCYEPLPEPNLLRSIEQRSELLTSKARLTSMFLNSAKVALKSNRFNGIGAASLENINRELHETLCHIEQEAGDAVQTLYDNFLERTSQCDNFEIGLQHQNIQVLRRGLLWLAQ
jgi:hypothetical protein